MKFSNVLDKVKQLAILAGVILPGASPVLNAVSMFLPGKVKNSIDTALDKAPVTLLELIDLCISIEKLVEAAKARGEVIGHQAKLAMLSHAISDTIGKAELLVDMELVDEALLKKAMDGYAQATVDFLKAVRPKD